MLRVGFAIGVALLLSWSAAAETSVSAWELPPEGGCASAILPAKADAPAFELRPGDVVGADRVDSLRGYLPPVIWDNRDRFFFAGMRIEVGPCFGDYSAPAAFREATEKFRGHSALKDDGGLADHVAGLPFPPDSIARDDPRAGIMWAWNVESRWQAGGFRGKFRVIDLVHSEPYEGEIWKRELARRADRPDDGYRVPDTGTRLWAAGGRFFEPFSARRLAWLQLRDAASNTDARRGDDLYFYMRTTRKVHDLPSEGIEGVFVPSFSMASQGGALTPGSGAEAKSAPESRRRAFEGLELRPLLYSFRVLRTENVLAPINAMTPAYPADSKRDFGPSGLSWASDRWDLRRSLVLEASPHDGGPRSVLWVDLQTLYPLYFASYDGNGEMLEVGYWVGRFSSAERTIEPVGSAFTSLHMSASWRRESWEISSAPEADEDVHRALSIGNLTKSQ